jgi:hypothetical protein
MPSESHQLSIKGASSLIGPWKKRTQCDAPDSYGGNSDRRYDDNEARARPAGGGGRTVDIEAIADPRSRSFQSEMRKASRVLRKVQSREFMRAVASHFKQGRLHPSEMIVVLESLQQILQQPYHLDMFVEMGIAESLPYDSDDDVFSLVLDVVQVLMAVRPGLFEHNFESRMIDIIQRRPQKAIVLFGLFCKALGSISDGWDLVDLLLEYRKTFFQASYGSELVSILFFLVTNFPQFRESRLTRVLNVFCYGLRSKDTQTVSNCYHGLSQFYDEGIKIESGLIVMHLTDDALTGDCLDFVIRVRDVPCLPELVGSLLHCSETRVESTLCLLRIAAIEEGARLIIHRPMWMSRDLPTILDTFRLFLAVMMHLELRGVTSRLKEVHQLFIRLCEEDDSRILGSISSVISRFEIDELVIGEMSSSGFLRTFFDSAIAFGDDIALKSAISVLMKVSKVAFSREYLILCRKLKELMLSERDICDNAVAAAVRLSHYPICARKFKDLNVDRIFKRMLEDREYRRYAEEFLENMADIKL